MKRKRNEKSTTRRPVFKNEDCSCFESVAQRVLPTVCAPCGNGICETEIESKCNCPEDCE